MTKNNEVKESSSEEIQKPKRPLSQIFKKKTDDEIYEEE